MFIVSQGNSISQVIASRIQNEILISIKKNLNDINFKSIVFDPTSLTNNINYSFFKTKYNLINTYYGAQVWEVWGIKGYVKNINNKKNIIIVNETPSIQDDMIVLSEIQFIKNKEIKSNIIKLLDKDIITLNYNNIYNLGFYYGKNE